MRSLDCHISDIENFIITSHRTRLESYCAIGLVLHLWLWAKLVKVEDKNSRNTEGEWANGEREKEIWGEKNIGSVKKQAQTGIL